MTDSGLPARQSVLGSGLQDYAGFLQEMLDAVAGISIPDGPNRGARPLATLGLDDRNNFAVSLLKSWAMVADILAFYQERIVNEGYLATARERRSVLELARAVGYELSPGATANVDLSFTVTETPGVTGTLVIPKGTAVESIPAPGEKPQVFETLEEVDVRGEWNSSTIKPDPQPATVEKGPGPGALQLDLEGTQLLLSPGDSLVLLSSPADPATSAGIPLATAQLVTIHSVTPDLKRSTTRVTWASPAPDTDRSSIGQSFTVIAFGRRASLFGAAAPDWSGLPDAVKVANGGTLSGGLISVTPDAAGPPADFNSGLPLAAAGAFPARALLAAKGALFAATAQGIYRRVPGGVWTAVNTGLSSLDFYSLAQSAQGDLFAGGAGAVYRSTNGGESWELLDGVVSVKRVAGSAAAGGVEWQPVSSRLPTVLVRCLQPDNMGKLYAGTDTGVFVYTIGSPGWTPVYERSEAAAAPATPAPGVPPPPAIPKLDALVVYALAAHPDGRLLAGTAQGIYSICRAAEPGVPPAPCRDAGSGNSWQPASQGLPNWRRTTGEAFATVRSIVTLRTQNSAMLYCAGDGGVFQSADGSGWTPMNDGFPGVDPGTGFSTVVVWSLIASPAGLLYAATSFGVYECAPAPSSPPQVSPPVGSPPQNRWLRIGPRQSGFQFTLPAAFSSQLDQGVLTPELGAAITAAGVPVPADAVLSAVVPGSLWQLALGSQGPAYSLELQPAELLGWQSPPTQPIAQFGLPAGLAADLNSGAVTSALRAAFATAHLTLSDTASVTVTTPGMAWLISSGGGPNYAIRLVSSQIDAFLGDVRAIALNGDTPVACMPSGGVVESDWPDLNIQGSWLDLDGAYPEIIAPGWALVTEAATDGAPPVSSGLPPLLLPVRSTTIVQRADYWLRQNVIRIETVSDAEGLLFSLPIRTAMVQAQSRELKRAKTQPKAITIGDGSTLHLQKSWAKAPLVARRTIVTGTRLPAEPAPAAASPGYSSPWSPDMVGANGPGQTVEPTLAVPRDESKSAHAVVTLQPVLTSLTGPVTALRMVGVTPASLVFDGSGLELYANIARATQGRTISPPEVLGNGDPTVGHQRFRLKQAPLAFIDPDLTGVPQSTLQVFVNQAPWNEVKRFQGAGPDSRVYLVRLDEEGRATVIFGDGRQGARLPAGTDNITAIYRVGKPQNGSLLPGAIAQLKSRPLGARSVTNHRSAVPAAPPQPLDSAQSLAPLGIRCLDRLVSVGDYEDFARLQPGVAAARARWVESGSSRFLELAIAWQDTVNEHDATSDGSNDRRKLLRQAIRQRQAKPAPIRIQPARKVFFWFQLTVFTSADPAAVEASVRRALDKAFGASANRLGTGVTSGQILAVIHGAPGVRGAKLSDDVVYYWLRPRAHVPGKTTSVLKAIRTGLTAAEVSPPAASPPATLAAISSAAMDAGAGAGEFTLRHGSFAQRVFDAFPSAEGGLNAPDAPRVPWLIMSAPQIQIQPGGPPGDAGLS